MSIWVKCMYVCGVWMCFRVFWSVQALYDAANALYWKCFKRQNSTHLKPLKHQNTKTSLYKLSKNHWVITLFQSFGSVKRDLQSTVSLDHPVESYSFSGCTYINFDEMKIPIQRMIWPLLDSHLVYL